MKLIILALIGAAAACAQNVNLTFNLTFSQAILSDVNLYWSQQAAGIIGTISTAVVSGDGTISVTLATPDARITTPIVLPQVNEAVLFDGEAAIVSAVSTASGVATLTLTRNVVSGLGAAAHAVGVSVYGLKYGSPYLMAADVLRQWAIGISQQLGSKSAVYSATVGGTIQ